MTESFEPQLLKTRHVDDIAEALPRCSSRLSRLFLKHANLGVSYTEIGILISIAEEPCGITELADREGIAQGGISWSVDRLVKRGWVVRERHPKDRRCALVTLTPDGHLSWQRIRGQYRDLMHAHFATLDDESVETLARAVDVLDVLIDRLMRRES